MERITEPITEPALSNAIPPPSPAPHRHVARLAKNVAANLLRQGTSWLIVLFVPPLLVRTMPKASYATWMLVLQLGAYATLFDGGLQMAVSRFVARAHHAGERTVLGEILSSAALLLTAAAAILLLLVGVGSFFFSHLFPAIPLWLQPQAAQALLLVGGSLALAFPSSVLAGFALGLERNQVNALAGSASKVVGSVGTVWAALHHQGIAVMAAWTAAGNLVQPLIFVAATWSHGLPSLLRATLVRGHRMWEFARFTSAMMVSQLGMLLISGLDLPIVASYDFRNAGYYAIATTLSNLLLVPQGAILTTLVPTFSGMSLDASPERMGQVLLRTTRLGTVLLALVAVPLMVGMPTLLRVWVGASYAMHTLVFGEVLVAAQLIRLSLMPYALIGFTSGQQSRMLLSPGLESLINLACSLLLVRRLGASGVALGTLIGACVGVAVHFLKSMPNTRSSLHFRRTDLLLHGILAPAAWAAGVATLLLLVLPVVQLPTLRLALVAAGVLLLAGIYWRFTLHMEDRNTLRVLLLRALPGRAALGRHADTGASQ